MTNELGRVVAVSGFHVKIELDATHRSPVRASVDGIETQIRINAFVTFSLGAADAVFGVITDLYAREVFEPDDEELTLELARPRRMAHVQLLGTVRLTSKGRYEFDPGVNLLPTLDTPAMPATTEILKAVLETTPKVETLEGGDCDTIDSTLSLGYATAAKERTVFGSYNDLLSRPFAIVGNTGSGKSCTIAHVIQEALRAHTPQPERPRFFVLDINGEFAEAFGIEKPNEREPNRIYINGKAGCVPLWLMNAHEVCQWLSASEQTQQPALVNLWALAKGAAKASDKGLADAKNGLVQLNRIISLLNDDAMRKKGGQGLCRKPQQSQES